MRTLGIDPGYGRLGLAVLEGNASSPSLVWSACVETDASSPLQERLAVVRGAVQEAVRTHGPVRAGIETLYFSTNKRTALAVAQARGVVLEALGSLNLPIFEFTPQQVKLAITGHGGSSKAALAAFLPRLVTLPNRRMLDDEVDAIAVALAALSSRYPHDGRGGVAPSRRSGT